MTDDGECIWLCREKSLRSLLLHSPIYWSLNLFVQISAKTGDKASAISVVYGNRWVAETKHAHD